MLDGPLRAIRFLAVLQIFLGIFQEKPKTWHERVDDKENLVNNCSGEAVISNYNS